MLIFTFNVSSFCLFLFESLSLPDTIDKSHSSHMHEHNNQDMLSEGTHDIAEGCSTDMASCLLSCTFSCVQLLTVDILVEGLLPPSELIPYSLPSTPAYLAGDPLRPPISA